METGLDRLISESLGQKQWGQFALLAHPASVDRHLVHVSDRLADLALFPRVIFGPEHGYGGEAQDMIGVADAKDARGIPVKSLYGASFEDLSPKGADLDGVESVVVDLQDVGARH